MTDFLIVLLILCKWLYFLILNYISSSLLRYSGDEENSKLIPSLSMIQKQDNDFFSGVYSFSQNV